MSQYDKLVLDYFLDYTATQVVPTIKWVKTKEIHILQVIANIYKVN